MLVGVSELTGFGWMRQLTGYTADVADGATITVSGTSAGYATNLIDDSNATIWGHYVTSGAFIGLQFSAGKAVIRATVEYTTGSGATAAYWPTSWLVQYSDDGSSWSTAGTLACTAAVGVYSGDVPDCGPHLYWRLTQNAATASGVMVAEVQMMEGVYSS